MSKPWTEAEIQFLRENYQRLGPEEIARQREGFRWTEEEDQELRRLFKQGLTYREIGERLGRSRAAVGHRLARIIIWEKVG